MRVKRLDAEEQRRGARSMYLVAFPAACCKLRYRLLLRHVKSHEHEGRRPCSRISEPSSHLDVTTRCQAMCFSSFSISLYLLFSLARVTIVTIVTISAISTIKVCLIVGIASSLLADRYRSLSIIPWWMGSGICVPQFARFDPKLIPVLAIELECLR